MIPGEILTARRRRSSSTPGRPVLDADRGQHRRPAGPGRLALPLRRGQPGAALRPRRRLRARGWTSRPAPSVRFEPGVAREVDLVPLGRRRGSCPACAARVGGAARWLSIVARRAYAALYGPTTGDRIRLADTDLLIEVERGPLRRPGGRRRGGLRRRQGDPRVDGPVRRHPRRGHARTWSSPARWSSTTGASSRPTSASATAGSSRSARPATPTPWTASTPDLVIGPSTEIIAGNGLILTAGGIDSHVHLIAPQQIADEALAAGITTLIGGGTGPAEGTKATTVTPGRLAPGADARGDRRLAGQRRAARQGQHGRRRGACGSSCGPARPASSCTRTGAPRRPRSTPA